MTRALIVVDVQESFRARPEWADMADPGIATQVMRLVEAARTSGDLVVWVLHSEPGSGGVFDRTRGHVRLMSELDRREQEPLLVKTTVNAFTSTDLQDRLDTAGVRDLVVCGIRTEQCCETTARLAGDLGFAVTFVTDATTTSGIDGLSATEIIGRTEAVLRERGFARIATTDEIVAAAVGAVPA